MQNTTKQDVEQNAPAGQIAQPLWAARLAGLTLGTARRIGGLSLYPLLGPRDGTLDYQTLDTALAAGTLTIGEVSASGTVPELKLTNTGARRVLLVDGEELVGAKQNRIVNTSVLVEAGSTLMLPVSCVEAGRWHAEGAGFRSEGTHYNARGRQSKVSEVSLALAEHGAPRANQGRVWADVDAKLAHFAVGSETRALRAVSDRLSGDITQFVDALAVPERLEVGAVFALGREIVGVDMFDQSATYALLLPKLVKSYALDALEEQPAAAPPPAAAVQHWLDTVALATEAVTPGVGLGQDIRLSGPGVSGAALVYGPVVHLSAFRAPQAAAANISPGMARASQRRRRA